MKKSGVRRGVLVYKGPDPAGKMEIPDETRIIEDEDVPIVQSLNYQTIRP